MLNFRLRRKRYYGSRDDGAGNNVDVFWNPIFVHVGVFGVVTWRIQF